MKKTHFIFYFDKILEKIERILREVSEKMLIVFSQSDIDARANERLRMKHLFENPSKQPKI